MVAAREATMGVAGGGAGTGGEVGGCGRADGGGGTSSVTGEPGVIKVEAARKGPKTEAGTFCHQSSSGAGVFERGLAEVVAPVEVVNRHSTAVGGSSAPMSPTANKRTPSAIEKRPSCYFFYAGLRRSPYIIKDRVFYAEVLI